MCRKRSSLLRLQKIVQFIFIPSFLLLFLIPLEPENSTFAQTTIAPNGPFGTDKGATPPPNQTNIVGGKNVSGNLFHSFSQFDVGTGHTANFISGGASNIISRVTDVRSQIMGTIAVDNQLGNGRPVVNLFLLNPHGILFGADAKIDLNGTFSVSNANSLMFGTGEFTMTSSDADVDMITGVPEAFGFTGGTPTLPAGSLAAMDINGLSNVTGVDSAPTSNVIVIGREGDPAGGSAENVPGVGISGVLNNIKGALTFFSVDSAGDVPLDVPTFDAAPPGTLGEITIGKAGINTSINTSGSSSGRLVLRGGKITIDNSILVANAASDISIKSTESVTITDADAISLTNTTISVDAAGSASALDPPLISLTVSGDDTGDAINLTDSELSTTVADQKMDFDAIKLHANEISLIDTGSNVTKINTTGTGTGTDNKSGNIVLQAKTLLSNDDVTGTGTIEILSTGTATTAAGGITLQGLASPADTMTLKNTVVNTKTNNVAGGDVLVEATTLDLQDGTTTKTETDGTAKAGDIELKADHISESLMSQVISESTPLGNEGTVSLDVAHTDVAFSKSFTSEKTLVVDGATVTSEDGSGGAVADSLVTIHQFVTPATLTVDSGQHNFTIDQDVTLTNATQALTFEGENITIKNSTLQSTNNAGTPNGSFIVKADNFTLDNSTVTATGTGTIGSGSFTAMEGFSGPTPQNIVLDDSLIQTTTVNGPGGAVNMTAETVNIFGTTKNRSEIGLQTSTSGTGTAGSVTVNAESATVNGATISSSSTFVDPAAGAAGGVSFNSTGSPTTIVSLIDAQVTTSILGGAAVTTPADITLFANAVHLLDASNVIASTDGLASAGDVSITTNVLNPSPDSVIDSRTTGLGAEGALTFPALDPNAPQIVFNQMFSKDGKNNPIFGGNSGFLKSNYTKDKNTFTFIPSKKLIFQNSSFTLLNSLEQFYDMETVEFVNSTFSTTNTDQSLVQHGRGSFRFNVDNLTITNSEFTSIGQSGADGGSFIAIQGKTVATPVSVVLENSLIDMSAEGTGKPGVIQLLASNTISLNDTELKASGNDFPGGGIQPSVDNLILTAPTITIGNSNLIVETHGTRNAGGAAINAEVLTISDSTTTSSTSFLRAGGEEGNAGDITVRGFDGTSAATSFTLSDSAFLIDSKGEGEGGTIDISSTSINLTNPFFNSRVNNVGAGENPDVVEGGGSIVLSGDTIDVIGGILPASAIPNAGFVIDTIGTRHAGSLTIEMNERISFFEDPANLVEGVDFFGTKGTFIGAATFGSGRGGSAIFKAPEITFNNPNFRLDALGGTGNAGTFTANAGSKINLNGGQITAFTRTSGEGGTITLQIVDSVPDLLGLGSQRMITLDGGTMLRSDTSSEGNAGAITVQANTVTVENSSITSSSGVDLNGNGMIDPNEAGTGAAGSVVLEGTTSPAILVTLDNAMISTSTIAGGVASDDPLIDNRGNITIHAKTLVAQNGTEVNAGTTGAGAAGDITLKAGNVDLTTGTILKSQSGSDTTGDGVLDTEASGKAGNIKITNEEITLPEGAITGVVTIRASEISTATKGPGGGGSIEIDTADTLTITDGTTITAAVDNGLPSADLADVTLTAPIVDVQGGSTITATTGGSKNAGQVTLGAETLTVMGATVSSNSAGGTGAAGSVVLEGTMSPAEMIALDNATISTTTVNGGLASVNPNFDSRGNIRIDSETLIVKDGTKINAGTSGSGPGGNITLVGGTLLSNAELDENGNPQPIDGVERVTISSNSSGAGSGGTISLEADTKLVLDATTVSASTESSGPGGSIEIESTSTLNPEDRTFGKEQLLLQNDTVISAESTGSDPFTAGDAGDITISSVDTMRFRDTQVTTKGTNSSGGGINLFADYLIHLINSLIESSVRGDATTQGGNIVIDPQFLILQNSQILATATSGFGGNIDITAGVFLNDAFSDINASSQFGVSGTISIDSPVQSLSGAIAPLPEEIIEVADLFNARCAAQKGGAFSSFTLGGQDSLPAEPGDFIPTPLQLNGVEPFGGGGISSRPSMEPVQVGSAGSSPISPLMVARTLGSLLPVFDSGCQSS